MPLPKYDESVPEEETLAEQPTSETEAPPETPESEEKKGDTFFVSADTLRQHCDPDSLKPGDVLSFSVVGKDSAGDVELAYSEQGDGGEGGEQPGAGMDKMKTDLAQYMSGAEE